MPQLCSDALSIVPAGDVLIVSPEEEAVLSIGGGKIAVVGSRQTKHIPFHTEHVQPWSSLVTLNPSF